MKTHGKAFGVRFPQKHTVKAARQLLTQQMLFVVRQKSHALTREKSLCSVYV
jgi:hypothetical protein